MRPFKLYALASAMMIILLYGCKKNTDKSEGPNLPEEKLTGCAIDSGSKRSMAIAENQEKQYRDVLLRAIGVEPAPCNVATPINLWLGKQFTGWSQLARDFTSRDELKMPYMAIYVAVLFEKNSNMQFFGLNGKYTHQLKKTFKDLKRFWNIDSDNIRLMAAHGYMLQDRNKVYTTYKAQFGYSDSLARKYADEVIASFKTYPEYVNGNHPFLTFNAYSHQEKTYSCVGQIQDKIVMGDGFLQAYDEIGYGDIAPQAILAHEFGH